MRADYRLCAIEEWLLHNGLDKSLKVLPLAPLPGDLTVGQGDENLLRPCCRMDADSLSCSLPEVLLVGFVAELVGGHRIAGRIYSDLTVPCISEEPDEGTDIRHLGHHLLVLSPRDPGNNRGIESRRKCWDLHVEAKSISGVDELLTVGGHG